METTPPQKKRGRLEYIPMELLENKRRRSGYIPTELVEKILLNLPVKSLSRFSTVSKSWNSTINSRDFSKRYRGREMIVMKPTSDTDAALVSPLSSILSCNPTANYLPLPLPISRLRASSGELWCLEFEDGSVSLYNPSTRARRELPANPSPVTTLYIYGLGYDSATDDHKVLRFDGKFTWDSELYSRRSETWRVLSGSSKDIKLCMELDDRDREYMDVSSEKGGVFVNGLLHWILIRFDRWNNKTRAVAILSFDLSTEKFSKVAWPEADAKPDREWVDLGVLRGKLCLYSDDRQGRGVMWALDDEGLWSKEVVFYYYFDLLRTKGCSVMNYSRHIFPENLSRHLLKVRPLYSYSHDNIKAFFATSHLPKIFLYEEGLAKMVAKDFGCRLLDCFPYVESMLKP